MNPTNFFKVKWRRPKHKGVSGNFSTLVIITGVVIGSYLMTGGGYPSIVPIYSGNMVVADPLPEQPTHGKTTAMTFRELRFTQRPTREPTPIPTFGPDEPEGNTVCENEAIAFLVDVSGSMLNEAGGSRKIDKLRTAMKGFTADLSDDALVGIYSFSEPFDGVKGGGVGEQQSPLPEPPKEPRERQSITQFGTIKDTIDTTIDELEPYPWAATYMRDGLASADQWLRAAKSTYPEAKRNLVFISDGIPETDIRNFSVAPTDTVLGPDRAYSPNQDPTKGINIGDRIKTDNVSVYSIVIYTADDTPVLDLLRGIMKNVASGQSEPFYNESVNATNIANVLTSIRNDICDE